MPGDQLTGSQDQTLSRWILGHVGRLVDDMKTLKMNPHRMGGVRQSPMRECIGCKQVAELVVELGFADAHYQPNGSAPQESNDSYEDDR